MKYKKRKDSDLYYIQINTGKIDSNNKIIYKTLYGKTQEELNEKVKSFKEKTDKEIITMNDLINLYLDVYTIHQKATTKITNKCLIEIHIRPYFKDLKIARIQHKDIQAFITFLNSTKKFSYGYLSNIKSLLHNIFQVAEDNQIIYHNPVAKIKINTEKSMPREAITLKQQQILFNFATEEKSDISIMCLLALYCGLRRSEILALTVNDFKDHTICINKQIYYNKNTHTAEIVSTKTSSSIREIPIPAPIFDIINEKVSICKERGQAIILFEQDNTHTYTPGKVDTEWNILKEKLNCFSNDEFGNVCLHQLRHTYCTNLKELGTDIFVIKECMGHSNIKTTYNVYTHLREKIEAKNENIVKNWGENNINRGYTKDRTSFSIKQIPLYSDYISKAANHDFDVNNEQWLEIKPLISGSRYSKNISRNLLNIILKIAILGIDVYSISEVYNETPKRIVQQIKLWQKYGHLNSFFHILDITKEDLSQYFIKKFYDEKYYDKKFKVMKHGKI